MNAGGIETGPDGRLWVRLRGLHAHASRLDGGWGSKHKGKGTTQKGGGGEQDFLRAHLTGWRGGKHSPGSEQRRRLLMRARSMRSYHTRARAISREIGMLLFPPFHRSPRPFAEGSAHRKAGKRVQTWRVPARFGRFAPNSRNGHPPSPSQPHAHTPTHPHTHTHTHHTCRQEEERQACSADRRSCQAPPLPLPSHRRRQSRASSGHMRRGCRRWPSSPPQARASSSRSSSSSRGTFQIQPGTIPIKPGGRTDWPDLDVKPNAPNTHM